MKNTKVLEMINTGELEQLKQLLTEEIYQDSLKENSDAKKRYAAMKRYFKHQNFPQETCKYPCKDIEVNGKLYNSFIDGYTFALTTESIEGLEVFDKSKGEYLDIARFADLSSVKSKELININISLAEAKSKGYKYKKSEVGKDFQYALKYKGDYYNIGLFDKAFSIVNDGKAAEVYYSGKHKPMIIKTSIGIAGILPFRSSPNVEEVKTIINLEH